MIATERKTSIRRVFLERILPPRVRRRRLEDYKDDSLELRRYLAAESANRQFEQRKDRALTENHRAGFMR